MRYFKIKVKNLILVMIAFVLLFTAILPFAYSKIAQGYSKKGKSEHAAVYYEKALSLTPDILRSGKDIYDYANALSGGAVEDSLYKIFPYGNGGSGSNMIPTDEALDTAINLYKDLIENHSSDPWAKWGYMRLTEIYIYLGEYKEAEKYLIAGKANADARLIYALYNATGEYDKGINLLEDLIENNKKYFDMYYYDSLAQLYMDSSKYDEAINTYKLAMLREEEMEKEGPKDEYYSTRKEELKVKSEKIEELRKGIGITGECRGRVTVNGIGIDGVRVYIKDKAIYKEDYIGSSLDFPFTTTDKDGYYSVDNVLPGEYDIGIGIRPDEILGKAYINKRDDQRILEQGGVLTNNFDFKDTIEILSPADEIKVSENKLEISWQKLEGAVSYSLVTGLIDEGSYGSSLFMDKIEDNKVVIDINQLIPRFTRFTSFYAEGKPTPGTLLGVYGAGKILYGVEAYDKDGKLISSSMPIIKKTKSPRHFIMVTPELEGDKFIEKQEYEKARNWFIDYLDKNPKNVHSLYVLARYYEYCEEDYEKAKEYLARLYEITKNEEYNKHIKRLDNKTYDVKVRD